MKYLMSLILLVNGFLMAYEVAVQDLNGDVHQYNISEDQSLVDFMQTLEMGYGEENDYVIQVVASRNQK